MDSEFFTQETFKRFAEFIDSLDWVAATLYHEADTPVDFIVHYDGFEYGYGYNPDFTIKASEVSSQKVFECLKRLGYVGDTWHVELDEDGYPNGPNPGVRDIEILANYQEHEDDPCVYKIGSFGSGEDAKWYPDEDVIYDIY